MNPRSITFHHVNYIVPYRTLLGLNHWWFGRKISQTINHTYTSPPSHPNIREQELGDLQVQNR